ncbi:MAG: hypothetical protein JNK63_07905 [Chthonomonas sp.]|nr:hypothetical protein [Chthonomonas sp.]
MQPRLIQTEWTKASLLVSQEEAIARLGVPPKEFTRLLNQRRIKRHASGVFLKADVEQLEKELAEEISGITPALYVADQATLPATREKNLPL